MWQYQELLADVVTDGGLIPLEEKRIKVDFISRPSYFVREE